MSLATWKEEFYRQEAREVPKDRALAHSLRKWIGLLPKALAKHGVVRTLCTSITDGREHMEINVDSCALCAHFCPPFCIGCPISKDTSRCSSVHFKPWGMFVGHGDPRPMIRVIRAAYEAEYAARKEKR